jgi:hypothetical protein
MVTKSLTTLLATTHVFHPLMRNVGTGPWRSDRI